MSVVASTHGVHHVDGRNGYNSKGSSGHCHPTLPGVPAHDSGPAICPVLGDLLKALAELMVCDVDLCSRLIGVLNNSEVLAGSPLTAKVVDVVRDFIEVNGTDLDSEARKSLKHVVDVLSGNRDISRPIKEVDEDRNGEGPAHNDDKAHGGKKNSDSGSTVDAADARRCGRCPAWFPATGNFRQRLFLLFDDSSKSIMGKVIAAIVMITIGISTISFVMESMPEFRERPEQCAELRASNQPLTVKDCEPGPVPVFFYIEAVCIAIFTIDYVVRMSTIHAMCSVEEDVALRALVRTFRYALEPLNIVDLLAVLPFYVGLAVGSGLGVMRILRLSRILRLFKTAKHHPGMLMFKDVMVISGQPLMILVFFNVIMAVLFGSLIYFAEGQRYSVDAEFMTDHPKGVFVRQAGSLDHDEVTPFRSIPYSLWWVLVTMTTVGYGDFSPSTRLGKAIGVVCFYVGIIFLALPISVLGSNFEIIYNARIEHQRMESNSPPQISAAATFQGMKRRRSDTAPFQQLAWMPQVPGFRRKIFLLLEDPSASKLGKIISVFVIATIVVSTVSFILESMPEYNFTPDSCVPGAITVENCRPKPDPSFYSLECICIVIFSVDYIARVGSVHSALPEETGRKNLDEMPALKQTFLYAMQWLNLIDLLAIIPFYVELAGGGGGGASVLRVLRLIRIFRVLKMPKMRACAEMFILIIIDALPALFLLLFMTMLMCVLFASLIVFAESSNYSVDHFQQQYPEGVYIRPTTDGYGVEPSPYRSIFYAFWWFFTTATTVGYGDDYPTTTAGRIVGVATFYTGIVLLALPITIVGGCFNKYYPDWVKEFGSDAANAAAGAGQPKERDCYSDTGQLLKENGRPKAWED